MCFCRTTAMFGPLVAALALAASPGLVSAQTIQPGVIGTVQAPPSGPDAGGAETGLKRSHGTRHYRRNRHVRPRAGFPIAIIERREAIAPPPPEVIVVTVPDDGDAEADRDAAVEPVPPDPGSPRSVVLARGVAPKEAPYEIGEPLPRGVPQVTLDWRSYGLPEPRPGEIYARVGRDVLLLEAGSRRVLGRHEPEAGAPEDDAAPLR